MGALNFFLVEHVGGLERSGGLGEANRVFNRSKKLSFVIFWYYV